MHPRQSIRAHIVGLLATGIPDVQERAFASRIYPLQRAELPCICVYTLSEVSEQESLTPPRMMRDLQLAVEIYTSDAAGAPDDLLDDLALQVEALMDDDITLGHRAFNSFLAETTAGFSGEGDQAKGIARLRYTVRYRTP